MVDNDVLGYTPSRLRLYLYRPTTPYDFSIESLKFYLEGIIGDGLAEEGVEVRDEFVMNYAVREDDASSRKRFAETMAVCRLEDIDKRIFPAEVNQNAHVFYAASEMNLLEGVPPGRSKDFMYHGPRLMNTYRGYLPEEERTFEHVHIIFTDRLFFSWGSEDKRYHARAAMMGFPNLVSMPGIVEAPARPREYYIKRHLYAASGLDLDELEAEFAGQYLIYKDARTLDALKCYSMQILFYSIFLEPFCDDPGCMLFNAHWQQEILAQAKSARLCARHKIMLENWIG